MMVRTGIEVLLRERLTSLQGARIGAVVHPASILSDYRHTADALLGEPSLNLVSLFGPQHGARGEKQDNMIESDHYRDPDTGIPVHSLYGETRRPTEAMLRDIDVLVYDLQDVGTRVYTFIWTMAYCMEACRRHGKRMFVLDRPNPIDGVHVEGNLLCGEFSSFVGLHPLPMRHGMTAGELALMFNTEFSIGCDLTVIPMQGWDRAAWFDETGLPWVPPSPNLPTLTSATVYPGMVLLEGTLASEGRGTTRPFEFAGAPYVNARALARHLNAAGLAGALFRPAYFEPTFQKHAGVMCGGVQLHVTDRQAFQPYLAGIAVISALRRLHPQDFRWRDPPYEYEYEKRPIEILCGGTDIPSFMESGEPLGHIRQSWQKDVAGFIERRRPFLLYS